MNKNVAINKQLALDLIIIFSYCVILYGLGLTTSALWDNDEGWYASIALNMVQTNDWIVPVFNGDIWFTKPPLMFWIMGLAMKLFGPNELAVRIFSVVFNTATVLLMYYWIRTWFNRNVAVLTAWVLATALLFAVIGRAAVADSYLVFFMTAALASFWFSFERRQPEYWWALATGVGMGLAMLIKGPMGIGFPLLTIIAYSLAVGQWRVLLSRKTLIAILGCVAVASPWYIASFVVAGPQIWSQFFIEENLLRFAVPIMGHKGPIWYYVPALLLSFLPWSLVLPWAYLEFYKQEKLAHKFIFAWIIFPIVIYSIMTTKLPHYLLHIFPALAIVVGWYGNKLINDKKNLPQLAFGLGFILNIAVFSFLLYLALQEPEKISWRLPLVGSLLPLSWLVAWISNQSKQPRNVIISLGLGTTIFLVLLTLISMPHFEPYRLVKPVLAKLQAAGFPPVPPEQTCLSELKTQDPQWLSRALKANRVMFVEDDLKIPALTFYSQAIVVRASTDECAYLLQQPTPVAIVFKDNRWLEFCKKYPQIAAQTHKLFEHSCIYEDEGRMKVIAVCNRQP